MPQLNYKGIYAAMEARGDFPPYKFVEFPKAVKNAAGKIVVVHSAREELAVAAEPSETAIEAVPPMVEERDKLAAANAELKNRLADLEYKLAQLEILGGNPNKVASEIVADLNKSKTK